EARRPCPARTTRPTSRSRSRTSPRPTWASTTSAVNRRPGCSRSAHQGPCRRCMRRSRRTRRRSRTCGSSASRRSQGPSPAARPGPQPGGAPDARGARRARLGALALLVREHLVDAALVTLVAAERLCDERIGDRGRLLERVHARADGADLRIVVLPRELGGLDAPDERRATALVAVGGELLAVARAADDDAQVSRARRHGLSRVDAEGGILVQGVVLEGSVVLHVVARLREVGAQVLL